MNEKINLCEILKDCPKGTNFYSTVFGEETYFVGINPRLGSLRPIIIHGKYGERVTFQLSRFGHPYADSCGECCLWPSKDVRTWVGWKCPKPKFDPKTLKPFDKVLGGGINSIWKADFFSHEHIPHEGSYKIFPYKCTGNMYEYCIPYNDDTKHLVGTKDEAPEYYRYWED